MRTVCAWMWDQCELHRSDVNMRSWTHVRTYACMYMCMCTYVCTYICVYCFAVNTENVYYSLSLSSTCPTLSIGCHLGMTSQDARTPWTAMLSLWRMGKDFLVRPFVPPEWMLSTIRNAVWPCSISSNSYQYNIRTACTHTHTLQATLCTSISSRLYPLCTRLCQERLASVVSNSPHGFNGL